MGISGPPQVRNPPRLRAPLPTLCAATRSRRPTAPGQVRGACQARILGACFRQAVRQDAFDRGGAGLGALLAHRACDSTGETMPVENCQGVMPVAALGKLRGMAPQGILRGSRSWIPCFYRMSRLRSSSRNLPYTILTLSRLTTKMAFDTMRQLLCNRVDLLFLHFLLI
jgi:hypothetical protein